MMEPQVMMGDAQRTQGWTSWRIVSQLDICGQGLRGQSYKEASQTRDFIASQTARRIARLARIPRCAKSARPDPSLRKKRLLGMTMLLCFYLLLLPLSFFPRLAPWTVIFRPFPVVLVPTTFDSLAAKSSFARRTGRSARPHTNQAPHKL